MMIKHVTLIYIQRKEKKRNGKKCVLKLNLHVIIKKV